MELLAPVGNFDNLIAAVQNGADAVYLGANSFNARANAKNFEQEELKKAILYARKRGVEVHLALNILLFNHEIKEALELAKFAYECGVSAIIVQDIGLAAELKSYFPDLPIHASTQMTITDSYGVQIMEKLGFKRVVLAREMSLKEIATIRKNTKLELECFGHGALCVSYSGQCLFSSMVGKRSGNRGLCAGPCRLNYQLLKDEKIMENGYLLSPKDICTLSILPQLINCGINSLKIEGRKKSYEYVSIVTKIYRKYIDLAQDKTKEYKVETEDLKQLLQIYNRGGMGTGYFENRQNIVYPQKPNHLGLYIGKVKAVNPKRKQITIDLIDKISMGDVIRVQEESSYISQIIDGTTVGEIKNGKQIKIKDKVYKIVDHALNKKQWKNHKKEVKKVEISCNSYKNGENICLELKNEDIMIKSSINIEKSDKNELDKQRIMCQIQKTGNTMFQIKDCNIEVEHLSLSISQLNQLRREAIQKFEEALEQRIQRKYQNQMKVPIEQEISRKKQKPKINLFLQKLNENIDYSKFDYHEIYVPLKALIDGLELRDCIVVLPSIIEENYEKLIRQHKAIFDRVKAVAIAHVSQIEFLKQLKIHKKIVANDTLNITNYQTEKVIESLGVKRFTISPELDKNAASSFSSHMEKELVVYGRTCLMTSKYCPIGKNENCHKICQRGKYALKDRKNFIFPIVSDCINCHSQIYNSKILSIETKDLAFDFFRIDVQNETKEEIERIMASVKAGENIRGNNFTRGNW